MNNNVILIKGLNNEKLKKLLDLALYYEVPEDTVIGLTDSPNKFVLRLPQSLSSAEFINCLSDLMQDESCNDCNVFGWFIADDKLYGAKIGACYMVTKTKGDDDDCKYYIPLIVDDNGKCYVEDMVDDSGNATCLCPWDNDNVDYRPCNLPKVTATEMYNIKQVTESPLLNRIIMKVLCGLSIFVKIYEKYAYIKIRIDSFLYRIFGRKFGQKVGKGLDMLMFILFIVFIALLLILPVIEGYNYYSDTIMDYRHVGFDVFPLILCAGFVVATIISKGVKFTRVFLTNVFFSSLAVLYIAGWVLLAVFGYNACGSTLDNTKEVRVKITDAYYRHSRSGCYYIVEFDLPFSKRHYYRGVGDDSSYLNRDSCTVFITHGRLGWDYIDDIE